jgi:polar amino acid transport system permease protein
LSRCGGAFVGLLAAQAVYTADLFRAAVDGVSQQTALAGRALGLKPHEVWRFIILPDVFRTMFPTLVAFTIGNIHLSSLSATVGCQEVMWVALTTGENTFRAFEALLIVACIYMVVVVTFGLSARWLERREWVRRHG